MSSGLPPGDLAAYLGTGFASLQAWAAVIPAPNIVRIKRRPQQRNFKPERLYVEQPENWMVHDLKIGGQSYFANERFASERFHPISAVQLVRQRLDCRLVQIGMDLEVAAEYIGDQTAGAFIGNMVGFDPETARPSPSYETMPLFAEETPASDPLHVVLDLGEHGVGFQIFRYRLVSAVFLRTRTAIDAALEEITAADGEISRPSAPIMISLRATSEELEGPILYATSENTSAVIFEISPRLVRCDFDGYRPPWWHEINEEIAAP
jgi:hypothetical protein